ncbi:MAG: phage head-tail connector protein [Nitrosarchaeum sp.]
MKISVITPTTYSPINLFDVKSHLRIPYGNTIEDDFLTECISASIDHTENFLNRKLTKQTVKVYFDDFPKDDFFELPYPPIRNIPSSGLVYTNSSGGSTQFSSTKWSQDIVSEPGRLVLKYGDDWPSDTLETNNPISIEYECGYGSTVLGSVGTTNQKLPAAIKHGLLMTVASWYEGRESYVQSMLDFKRMPIGAKMIMNSYRIKTF